MYVAGDCVTMRGARWGSRRMSDMSSTYAGDIALDGNSILWILLNDCLVVN